MMVCVVIAARNASNTIARAITSALRETKVGEVIVVDDASTDDTAGAAQQSDDGSGRLHVLRLSRNCGPAFARNHAVANSTAPLIAILDADDFFLKGRFEALLDGDDWDFVADNITFIDADDSEPDVPRFAPEPYFLDLRAFIEGNIARRGVRRGEIGFLKPVMRRAFLDRHGLRYDERLRLGEDYDLYARALVKGARYKVVRACGYGAVVRPDSLSGQHSTDDLKRLWEADQALIQSPSLPDCASKLVKRHSRHVRARYELRRFLDVKAASGLTAAMLDACAHPMSLPGIAGGIFADKAEGLMRRRKDRRRQSVPAKMPRYLLRGRLAMPD
ncbi:glycosyltransferase family 2 protein [Chelativorans salis]|uniref:Glycosyltransferase n=1 Tax=Chelativorans salis TaxID=2978478 RepID=A0ABT2LTH7_9HYPH|nr:glycosyltransferase family 2 protein [Chelativorans sp. EGI FJ00035]MCT7377841.1 glycosyltransferase [Chelativorans sp. EGI FJ00035]